VPASDHDLRHPARAAMLLASAFVDPRARDPLEGIARGIAFTRNPPCLPSMFCSALLARFARQPLRCRPLPLIALSPVEQIFAGIDCLSRATTRARNAPSRSDRIHHARARKIRRAARRRRTLLVTSAAVLRSSRAVERFAPRRPVLSQAEIPRAHGCARGSI